VEQARQAFTLCREVGIDTMAYFIVGNPGETLEDVKATLDLACELKPTMVQFSRMTPMPATDLYEMGLSSNLLPKDYWKIFAQDPLGAVAAGFRPMVWTENFTEDELFALADHHTRAFYFRPKYILRSMLHVRSLQDVRRKVKAAHDLRKATFSPRKRPQKLI
jgi:anaerobic magnesium-protoporphyrin IX monomethyl ester cyclase